MSSIFQENPQNYYSDKEDSSRIILMAGKPNLDAEELTPELCAQLKDCGFNAVGAVVGYSKISSSLTNCADNNLKLFLYNAALFHLPEQMIPEFSGRAGLGGWLMNFMLPYEKLKSDQPTANGLPPIKEAYKNVAELDLTDKDKPENARNKLLLNNPIFIGMGGDWNRDVDYKAINLPGYIKDFQDAFNPSIWPVAYFPDLVPEGSTEIPEERIQMYYKTLQYMSYVSQYTATPFWFYVRCQAFEGYYKMNGPTPQIGLMRSLIFTALAYGAQGIYYWNYREDPYVGEGFPTFWRAPIDRDGKKTATWLYLQLLNKEVAQWFKLFAGCQVVECRHLRTDKTNTEWLRLMKHPMGPLMKVTMSTGEEPNMLISHINKDGRDYLVLILDALYHTPGSYVLLNLEFNEYWNVSSVSGFGKLTGEPNLSPLVEYKYTARMSSGYPYVFTWD